MHPAWPDRNGKTSNCLCVKQLNKLFDFRVQAWTVKYHTAAVMLVRIYETKKNANSFIFSFTNLMREEVYALLFYLQ